jgi:hypothetical protein
MTNVFQKRTFISICDVVPAASGRGKNRGVHHADDDLNLMAAGIHSTAIDPLPCDAILRAALMHGKTNARCDELPKSVVQPVCMAMLLLF